MPKAVLTYKPQSLYDDDPEVRYHFPRTYLKPVEAAVGDFIVYYEPGRTGSTDESRTGRLAYVAVARLERLERDPLSREHYYAYIEPGSFISFDEAVPFRHETRFYEQSLRKGDGTTNKGAFGRAVRALPDIEFEAILRAGFSRPLHCKQNDWDLPATGTGRGVFEEQEVFERPVVERVMSRPLRDAAFTRAVRDAYGATCAMSGLKLTNGGGRPEVQAAHIRPVEHRGPDSVRNGIALSGTFHWMFDRGLIAVGPPPAYELRVSHKGLPEKVLRMINSDGRLRVPEAPTLRPAPVFLDFHRSRIFDRSE